MVRVQIAEQRRAGNQRIARQDLAVVSIVVAKKPLPHRCQGGGQVRARRERRKRKVLDEAGQRVLLQPVPSRLRAAFLTNDLKYGREVTPERAAEFADPDDVIYQFRKSIGQFFEDAL